MKPFNFAAAALAVAMAASSANATITLNFAGGSAVPTPGTTVIEDFELYTPGTPGASIGTNAYVYDASISGSAARPAYGSTGNFGVVLGTPNMGTYEISFAPTNVFAFTLGSLDTYNTLTLKLVGGGTVTYAGGQIINDLSFPSGDQISGETNGQISYTVTSGPLIVGAIFNSTQNSFEFDNLAIAAVPEPASWAMMILGLGLVGRAMRGTKRNSAVQFA